MALRETLEEMQAAAFAEGDFTKHDKVTRQLAMVEVWDAYHNPDEDFKAWLKSQCLDGFELYHG